MDVEKLSSAIATFSAEFCKEVESKNSMVSSPLSAELVLALLALGTTGRANQEILTSLHLPDKQFIRSTFAAISSQLSSVKGVTLNIANKVYLKDGPYELNEQFKADAVQVFGAEVDKLNCDNGAAAANTVNKWVEDKTNKRIKDIFTPDSINSDTRLVLVNALYFKGSWKDRFDPRSTSNAPFHVTAEKVIDIPFMHITKTFNYGVSKELGAKLLEMPYEGGEASLLVVLPDKVDGLDALLGQLASGADLNAAIKNMRPVKVEVSLPKFKIETEIDLMKVLPKLGIKEIFNQNNDGLRELLNKPEQLYVSKAVQKAFIEVNEEGAEAAAATAAMVRLRRSLPADPVQFDAQRAALYCVVARGTLLVAARFSPEAPAPAVHLEL